MSDKINLPDQISNIQVIPIGKNCYLFEYVCQTLNLEYYVIFILIFFNSSKLEFFFDQQETCFLRQKGSNEGAKDLILGELPF